MEIHMATLHKTPIESTTTPGTIGHFLPQILHTVGYSRLPVRPCKGRSVQLPERMYDGRGIHTGILTGVVIRITESYLVNKTEDPQKDIDRFYPL